MHKAPIPKIENKTWFIYLILLNQSLRILYLYTMNFNYTHPHSLPLNPPGSLFLFQLHIIFYKLLSPLSATYVEMVWSYILELAQTNRD